MRPATRAPTDRRMPRTVVSAGGHRPRPTRPIPRWASATWARLASPPSAGLRTGDRDLREGSARHG
jgi:hypothetical protein